MVDPITNGSEPEETEEEANLFVVDPDDYQRTKKLESIHDAKREVLKVRRNRSDIIAELEDKFREPGHELYRRRLGTAIAQYGNELVPLIEKGLEGGALTEEDLRVLSVGGETEIDIQEYIRSDGMVEYEDELLALASQNAMQIYRQLERIQQKLGLGLELEEEKGPARI